MMAFLPDQTARRQLVLPTQVDVDFRAACFCHKKVVDVGFVCSICLSSRSNFLFCCRQLFLAVLGVGHEPCYVMWIVLIATGQSSVSRRLELTA